MSLQKTYLRSNKNKYQLVTIYFGLFNRVEQIRS